MEAAHEHLANGATAPDAQSGERPTTQLYPDTMTTAGHSRSEEHELATRESSIALLLGEVAAAARAKGLTVQGFTADGPVVLQAADAPDPGPPQWRKIRVYRFALPRTHNDGSRIPTRLLVTAILRAVEQFGGATLSDVGGLCRELRLVEIDWLIALEIWADGTRKIEEFVDDAAVRFLQRALPVRESRERVYIARGLDGVRKGISGPPRPSLVRTVWSALWSALSWALRALALAAVVIGLHGCANVSPALGSACQPLGLCDAPAGPALLVYVLCDTTIGASCAARTLKLTLDVVLRRTAQRPGSRVRRWPLGATVADTVMVGEQSMQAGAHGSEHAQRAQGERFVAAAREYIFTAAGNALHTAPVRWSPIAESLSKIGLVDAAELPLELFDTSDHRETTRQSIQHAPTSLALDRRMR